MLRLNTTGLGNHISLCRQVQTQPRPIVGCLTQYLHTRWTDFRPVCWDIYYNVCRHHLRYRVAIICGRWGPGVSIAAVVDFDMDLIYPLRKVQESYKTKYIPR